MVEGGIVGREVYTHHGVPLRVCREVYTYHGVPLGSVTGVYLPWCTSQGV